MSNLDQKIENAANKIEVAANKAWKKRSFRIVSKSVSAAAEIGLMIGAAHFSVNHKVIFDYLFKSSYMPV